MIAKTSPLELDDFYILENNYKFIPIIESQSTTFQEAINQYKIDIDYRITIPDEDNEFNVFLKAGINYEDERLPGYSIYLECVGVFKMHGNDINSDVKSNLMSYSCVTMLIGCMRGKIKELTSDGPIGKYILPSIDMQDLEKQKFEKVKRNKKKVKSKELE